MNGIRFAEQNFRSALAAHSVFFQRGAIALETIVHTVDKIKAMVVASAVVLRLLAEGKPFLTSNDGLGSQLLNL